MEDGSGPLRTDVVSTFLYLTVKGRYLLYVLEEMFKKVLILVVYK